jgi:mono/diheme cytochrome c family protein
MILRALAIALFLAVAACDESEVWHAPEPTLERMQDQPRADPFQTMRDVPAFTVARGESRRSPPPVTRALLERGRGRFDTVCATCHGILGDGDSVVATKMLLRAPPSLHEARIAALSEARTYEIVTRGYGVMPGYAWQLSEEDRWAVVHYLRALRISQSVRVADLPAPMQRELAEDAP